MPHCSTGEREYGPSAQRSHIEWLTARRAETFIGFIEMRNLAKDDYKKCTALRKRYEDFVTAILEQGVAEKKFVVADPRITTFAILNMLSGAYAWYKKGGRLSKEQLDEIYADRVFKMIDMEHLAPPAPRN